ncbi:MAG: glycosyltransferase [Desulfovibrionaceae bacterium]
MKKVSIVVPTYNQAAYLPTCLDSIWFQEYPDVEIVVVNDGSPDDTAKVLDAYARGIAEDTASYAADFDEQSGEVRRVWHARYPAAGRSLVCLAHDPNQGLSAALNTGFKAATGEYCTFIASDDMLLPGMVEGLVAALEAHDADFAYADMHVVDDTGRILRRFSLPDYTFEAAFCHWYLCGVCKLYRRELHERHGYFHLDYTAQDHEMYLRFAMGGARFVHVPKVLAHVRIHDRERNKDNHSEQNVSRLFRESQELVRRARAHAGMSRV